MANIRQRQAAKKNIQKAQQVWQGMNSRQRALAQPEGKKRKKPGTGQSGDYYHVKVRPKNQFTSFRTQDIGREGHTQRVAGRRSSGSWATHKWLVHKSDAKITENGQLEITSPKVRGALAQVRGPIMRDKGDIFKAKPRKNVPEKEKPTPAQKKARQKNIKKAQKSRQT